MYKIVARYFTIITLLLLVVGVTACGGGQKPPPAAAPQGDKVPSGDELITKMEETIKATNNAHFTVDFQIAAAEGPVKGTVEFWGERPSKMRAEITSEATDINGIIVVADGEQGWAYNPNEKMVVIADKSQYQAQLSRQPELRDVVGLGKSMVNIGFKGVTADNQGAEQVNGRDTYKVQVSYAADSDLANVTPTFWIDKETYLPQQVKITVENEDVTASGFLAVQGDIATDQTIDATVFSFEPPEGTTVLNLNDLPKLPTLPNPPVVE